MITCLAFLAIATWVAYRGIDATEKVQIVLVSFQMIVLLVFAIMAIVKSGASGVGEASAGPGSRRRPHPVGLHRRAVGRSSASGAGTPPDGERGVQGLRHGPGRAALLCVISILITYLLVTIAMQMYAGMGDTGLGLTNEEVSDNVFGNLAEPVMGTRWISASTWRCWRLGGQSDHHLPADNANAAGDGRLRGAAARVRAHCTEVTRRRATATSRPDRRRGLLHRA